MGNSDGDLYDIADTYESENDPIDYEEFVRYYEGEMSEGSIVQYLRYLSKLDFDPVADQPTPDTVDMNSFELSQFKRWAVLKSKSVDGDSDRFKYFTYLALRKYLEAVGEPQKLGELPPSKQFNKPDSDSPTTKYTEEQVQKILDSVSDENQQLRLAIIHMFYSGMRAYEVLNCSPEWYDFSSSEDTIEIEIPSEYAKGKKNSKKAEYCFLPPKYEEEIKKYIVSQYEYESYEELVQNLSEDNYNSMFDFIEGEDSDMDSSDKGFRALALERYFLNKNLKEVAQKSGINNADDISTHRLRKSFVHHIYEGEDGLNLSRTSKLARHKNVDLTDKHYLNIDKKEKKQDYEKVFS